MGIKRDKCSEVLGGKIETMALILLIATFIFPLGCFTLDRSLLCFSSYEAFALLVATIHASVCVMGCTASTCDGQTRPLERHTV